MRPRPREPNLLIHGVERGEPCLVQMPQKLASILSRVPRQLVRGAYGTWKSVENSLLLMGCQVV